MTRDEKITALRSALDGSGVQYLLALDPCDQDIAWARVASTDGEACARLVRGAGLAPVLSAWTRGESLLTVRIAGDRAAS